MGTSTRQSHLHGISFPINQDAVDALLDLKADRVTYVRLVREGGREGGRGRDEGGMREGGVRVGGRVREGEGCGKEG